LGLQDQAGSYRRRRVHSQPEHSSRSPPNAAAVAHSAAPFFRWPMWPAWLSGGAAASIGAPAAAAVVGGAADWPKSDGSSGTAAGFGVGSGVWVVVVSPEPSPAVPVAAEPAPAVPERPAAAGSAAEPFPALDCSARRRLMSAGDDGSPGAWSAPPLPDPGPADWSGGAWVAESPP
jgi:hypothetical protein